MYTSSYALVNGVIGYVDNLCDFRWDSYPINLIKAIQRAIGQSGSQHRNTYGLKGVNVCECFGGSAWVAFVVEKGMAGGYAQRRC
jgi:hypothetical protein